MKETDSWVKLLVVAFVVMTVVLAMEFFPLYLIIMGTCFVWDKVGGRAAFATFIALLSMYTVYIHDLGEMISEWFDDEKRKEGGEI